MLLVRLLGRGFNSPHLHYIVGNPEKTLCILEKQSVFYFERLLNGRISMKKVIVIGCPGGGKSTFSRSLAGATGIPLHHLDMMNWNADRTIVEKEVFMSRLQDAISQDSWIIDGNYNGTMEMRIQACDTVFFLDYPLEVCLSGIQERKGKPRSDMPWIEPADEDDEEFITFIKDFREKSRPRIIELLKKYDREVYHFTSRSEAEQYLTAFQAL